ncbi:MAG: sulfotransferase domain-containing protein [Gammaproteobacteria bacterium]
MKIPTFDGVRRYCYVISPFKNNVIVTEYPKSGGTWLTQMVADSCGFQFPKGDAPISDGIIHGHYLRVPGNKKKIVLWRDPRDVIISYYHHIFCRTDPVALKIKELYKPFLPHSRLNNIMTDLPFFSELVMEGSIYPRFSYRKFFECNFQTNGNINVFYENLRKNTSIELKRVCESLTGEAHDSEKISKTVDRFSFSRLSGRATGEEKKDSALRKGIVGDHVNYFSSQQLDEFDRKYGFIIDKLMASWH